jgi:NADPH2:quinone reductase
MEMNTRHAAAEERVRALVQRSHEGPKDLTLTTHQARPMAGPDDYLVRVTAAGVNFADVMQSHGTYAGGPGAPYVAGFEAVGEIVGVGARVARALPIGTHVVGAGPGAFAQYMTMPASGALRIPAGWADEAALGLVLNWATAVAALKPLGEIKRGETVLVHAAAGGVGQAAVRLARHYGARVIATASPAKHEMVRAAGASEVLDGRSSDLAEQVLALTDRVDLVLESVGRSTFAASMAVTRPFTGRIVVFGAASGDATVSTHDLVFTYPIQIKGLHIGAMATAAPDVYRSVLAEIESLIDEGVYQPGTPETHPLADGPAVLRLLEEGRTSGKHALDPWR